MKKFILFSLVVVLLLCSFGSCGKGTEKNNSGDISKSGSKTLGGRVVTIAHWEDFAPNEESSTYQEELEIVQGIEKKYDCTLDFSSTGDWGVYNTNATLVALSGGVIGDIIGHQFDLVIPQWAKSGLISPIEDYVNLDDKILNKAYNDMYKYNGHYYGVTAQPQCLGHVMLFNKKVCSEFGITDTYLYDLLKNNEWTWSKFEELAIKCTNGTTWGFGSFGPVAANPEPWMYTNGTTPVLQDPKTFALSYNFDNSACIGAADFCRKLINDDKVCFDGSREDGTWEKLWVDGKIAFYQCPSWVMGGYPEQMEDDIGLLMMPYGPSAKTNVNVQAPVDGWFIQSNVQDKEVIGEILQEFLKIYKLRLGDSYAETYKNWVSDDQSIDVINSIQGKTIPLKGYAAIEFITNVIYHDFGIYEGKSSRAFAEEWKAFSQSQFDSLANTTLKVEESVE